jgi:hypothetical protein
MEKNLGGMKNRNDRAEGRKLEHAAPNRHENFFRELSSAVREPAVRV